MSFVKSPDHSPGGAALGRALGLEQGAVVSLVGAGGKTSLMFRLARELALSGAPVLTTTTTRISEREAAQYSPALVNGPVRKVLGKAKGLIHRHTHITAVRENRDGKLAGYTPAEIERLWQSGIFTWIIVEADGAARLPLKVPAAHEPVIPACSHCVVGLVGLTAFAQPFSDQWVFRADAFKKMTGLRSGDRIDARSIATCLCHPDGIFKGAPPGARRVVFLNQADTPERAAAGRSVIADLAEQPLQALIQSVILGQLLFDPPVIEIFDF